MQPTDFQVDEARILFMLNTIPVTAEEDGDFNVVALMDAASCYILAMEFSPVIHSGISQLDSKRLLKNG